MTFALETLRAWYAQNVHKKAAEGVAALPEAQRASWEAVTWPRPLTLGELT